MVEDDNGIIECLHSAIVNLFEMGFPLANQSWIDVEGHSILGKPERVQARICLIHLFLHVEKRGSDSAEFGNGGSIDLLDPADISIGWRHFKVWLYIGGIKLSKQSGSKHTGVGNRGLK